MKRCQYPGVAVLVNGEEHHVSPEAPRDFFYTHVMPKIFNTRPEGEG
jgi:hypothetical protein